MAAPLNEQNLALVAERFRLFGDVSRLRLLQVLRAGEHTVAAAEVLERAPAVLAKWGFDPEPLGRFRERLRTRRLPGDDLVELYESGRSIPEVLRTRADLIPTGKTDLRASTAR